MILMVLITEKRKILKPRGNLFENLHFFKFGLKSRFNSLTCLPSFLLGFNHKIKDKSVPDS